MTAPAHCRRCTLRHTPHCQGPRWPLAPLLARINSPNIPKALGVKQSSLAWAAEHGLSDALADRWAIRAGFHPSQVWPDWVDAGLSVGDRRFLASGWRHAWLHAEATPSSPSLPSTKERDAA